MIASFRLFLIRRQMGFGFKQSITSGFESQFLCRREIINYSTIESLKLLSMNYWPKIHCNYCYFNENIII